jgi:hypothetical protein
MGSLVIIDQIVNGTHQLVTSPGRGIPVCIPKIGRDEYVGVVLDLFKIDGVENF